MNLFEGPHTTGPVPPWDVVEEPKYPLLVLSSSRDPDQGNALGLFYPPHSPRNDLQLLCRDASGAVVYSEERRRRMKGIAGIRGTPQFIQSDDNSSWKWWGEEYHIRWHLDHTGMFSAGNPYLASHGNCTEEVWMEVYLIFGTPNQILIAAQQIEAAYGTRTFSYEL